MLRGPEARLRLVSVLFALVFVVIIGRLVWLQVIVRADWKKEVDTLLDRPYGLPSPPPGVILDRNGDLGGQCADLRRRRRCVDHRDRHRHGRGGNRSCRLC